MAITAWLPVSGDRARRGAGAVLAGPADEDRAGLGGGGQEHDRARPVGLIAVVAAVDAAEIVDDAAQAGAVARHREGRCVAVELRGHDLALVEPHRARRGAGATAARPAGEERAGVGRRGQGHGQAGRVQLLAVAAAVDAAEVGGDAAAGAAGADHGEEREPAAGLLEPGGDVVGAADLERARLGAGAAAARPAGEDHAGIGVGGQGDRRARRVALVAVPAAVDAAQAVGDRAGAGAGAGDVDAVVADEGRGDRRGVEDGGDARTGAGAAAAAPADEGRARAGHRDQGHGAAGSDRARARAVAARRGVAEADHAVTWPAELDGQGHRGRRGRLGCGIGARGQQHECERD
jgi:hypothetical protein